MAEQTSDDPSGPSAEPEAPAQQAAPTITLPNGRRYETLILTFTRLEGDAVTELSNGIRKTIESSGGAGVEIQNFGRRRLAYEISDQTDGIYVNFAYEAVPEAISKIDAALRLNESLMRHLTTAVGAI